MLRWSVVVLVGLAGCAELKSAAPPGENDGPPATTSVTPTVPQASPARPAPADASPFADDDAGVQADDAGAVETIAPADRASVLCENLCEYRSRCSTTQPFAMKWCTGGCLGLYGPQTAHLRSSYVHYTKDCLAIAACSAGADACLDAWAAIAPSPATVPVVQACLSKTSECPAQVKADACYALLRYDDPTRDEAARCFDRTCVDIEDCLGTVTTGTIE